MPPEKQKENPLYNFPSLQTGYFKWKGRITKKYWLNLDSQVLNTNAQTNKPQTELTISCCIMV